MLNRVFLAAAGLLFLTSLAHASPVTYTDFASWSAATADVTDVSFASVGFERYFGSGFSSGDVTVTSPQAYLFGWGPHEAQDLGVGMYLIGAYNSGASVSETFSGEAPAVGNEVALYDASGELDYTFTTNSGDTGSARRHRCSQRQFVFYRNRCGYRRLGHESERNSAHSGWRRVRQYRYWRH